MEEYKDIVERFQATVKSLSYEDKEFSIALSKWEKFFCTLSYKGSFVVGIDPEDFSQELLQSASVSNSCYKLDLYRFKGRIYELISEEKLYCVIRTLRFNKGVKRSFVVDKNKLEKVKKGKLSSVIYTAIYQSYCDLIRGHYTVKNGYKVVDDKVKRLVKVRSEDVISYSFKDTNTVEKYVNFHSLQSENQFGVSLEDIVSASYSPRHSDSTLDLETLYKNLPEGPRRVFKSLLYDPKGGRHALTRELDTIAVGAYKEILVETMKKMYDLDELYNRTPMRF